VNGAAAAAATNRILPLLITSSVDAIVHRSHRYHEQRILSACEGFFSTPPPPSLSLPLSSSLPPFGSDKEMAAAAPVRKTCLYEVLSVERNVDTDALKKAYRKSVARAHNPLSFGLPFHTLLTVRASLLSLFLPLRQGRVALASG
jgi:hypothetical protein